MTDMADTQTTATIDATLQEVQQTPVIEAAQMKDWALNRGIDTIDSETLSAMAEVLVSNISEQGGNIDPSTEKLRDQLQAAIDRTEAATDAGQPDYLRSFGAVVNVLSEKAGLSLEALAEETNEVRLSHAREDALQVIKQQLETLLPEVELPINELPVSEIPAAPIAEFTETPLVPDMIAPEDGAIETRIAALNKLKETLAVQFENMLSGETNLSVQDAGHTAQALADALKNNNADSVITAADVQTVFQPIEADSAQQFKQEFGKQLEFDTISADIAASAPMSAELKQNLDTLLDQLVQDETKITGNQFEPLGIREDEYLTNAAQQNNLAVAALKQGIEQYQDIAEHLQKTVETSLERAAEQPENAVADVQHQERVASPELEAGVTSGRF